MYYLIMKTKDDKDFKMILFEKLINIEKYKLKYKIGEDQICNYGYTTDNTEINFCSKTGEVYYMKAL